MGEVLKREIIQTADGSNTIFIPGLKENYHSIHGAIGESLHVFIEAGLKHIQKNNVSIFEMGFGTGLNCLLTWLYRENRKIVYHALEKYPLEQNITHNLNFHSRLNLNKKQIDFYKNIHELAWDCMSHSITEDFTLLKEKQDLAKFQSTNRYDLIYFDAFAPNIQPDLWSVSVFKKMFTLLNDQGIIVTYCAKGQVRRNLIECGFDVQRLPGPVGKREMIRGQKL